MPGQDVQSIGPAPYFIREMKADEEGSETAKEERELEDADALWEFLDARGRMGLFTVKPGTGDDLTLEIKVTP